MDLRNTLYILGGTALITGAMASAPAVAATALTLAATGYAMGRFNGSLVGVSDVRDVSLEPQRQAVESYQDLVAGLADERAERDLERYKRSACVPASGSLPSVTGRRIICPPNRSGFMLFNSQPYVSTMQKAVRRTSVQSTATQVVLSRAVTWKCGWLHLFTCSGVDYYSNYVTSYTYGNYIAHESPWAYKACYYDEPFVREQAFAGEPTKESQPQAPAAVAPYYSGTKDFATVCQQAVQYCDEDRAYWECVAALPPPTPPQVSSRTPVLSRSTGMGVLTPTPTLGDVVSSSSVGVLGEESSALDLVSSVVSDPEASPIVPSEGTDGAGIGAGVATSLAALGAVGIVAGAYTGVKLYQAKKERTLERPPAISPVVSIPLEGVNRV